MGAAMKLALALSLTCLAVMVVACDDPKPKGEPAKSADAKPAAAPAASERPVERAAEAPPPAPKKVWKCEPGPIVKFGDEALELELRRKLNKAKGPISPADLRTVRSVNLSSGKVNELDPCVFPLLLGVKDVFLGPGDLSDLTPLAGLITMESLRASINKVSDLTPLSKLTKLDRLDLGRTGVRDLTPLAKLANLTELSLDGTEVKDLTPLAGCVKLERLSLKNTQVTDVTPLKDLKGLKFLYIEGTPIEETGVLSPLTARGLKIVR